MSVVNNKWHAFKLTVKSHLLISFVRQFENNIYIKYYNHCLFFIFWIPIKVPKETLDMIILHIFADNLEMILTLTLKEQLSYFSLFAILMKAIIEHISLNNVSRHMQDKTKASCISEIHIGHLGCHFMVTCLCYTLATYRRYSVEHIGI